LIEEVYKIKHLPITIIQGRYDIVCPAKTSWELYQALGGHENSNVEYRIIKYVGLFILGTMELYSLSPGMVLIRWIVIVDIVLMKRELNRHWWKLQTNLESLSCRQATVPFACSRVHFVQAGEFAESAVQTDQEKCFRSKKTVIKREPLTVRISRIVHKVLTSSPMPTL
jgi:hypothetical protein